MTNSTVVRQTWSCPLNLKHYLWEDNSKITDDINHIHLTEYLLKQYGIEESLILHNTGSFYPKFLMARS
jgi:hypothetical protein